MFKAKRIAGCLLLLVSAGASARGPAVLFDAQGAVVALVGVEQAYTDAMDNCSQHIATVAVDEVAYDGPSESIAGFRVDPETSSNGVTLYRLDASGITAAQMRELRRLFRRDARLVVLGQTCGAGRFTSIREVWLASAMGK